MLLMAVGLWVAYLVPSYVRRRNYLSTERNAVRLQQALRALAETAEVPSDLHVETSARGVAEQERRVRHAKRVAEQAGRQRRAAAEKALPAVRMPRDERDRRRAAAATRRGRLLTTTIMFAGVAVAGTGAWLGAQAGNWWVLVGGAIVVLAACAMLHQLARVAAAQRLVGERHAEVARTRTESSGSATTTAPQPRVAQQLHQFDVADGASAEPAEQRAAGWTPVAVPRPLYLREQGAGGDGPWGGGPQGPDGGRHTPAVDIEALRAAARASEQAIRDAHRQPGVITFGREAVAHAGRVDASMASTQPILREALSDAVHLDPIEAPPGRLASRPSRWERMGIVAEDEREQLRSPLRRRAG
ncbi:hypothetical protein GCM10011490_11180 [Pseudoclavibacter endophyticus]|nr:hypothetical protein GCM10011490_11180 [Pseudoclavibacter endophyticus]